MNKEGKAAKDGGGADIAQLTPLVYERISDNKDLIGGPSYNFDRFRTSAQAAAEGDSYEKGSRSKKSLKKTGPTVSISPISNLPICDYGDWAKKFDDENDPTTKPKLPPRRVAPLNPALVRLKSLLKSRGAGGIISLKRVFKLMDGNCSGHLDKEEFKRGMLELSLQLTDTEMNTLFAVFDKDKSGTIDFDGMASYS